METEGHAVIVTTPEDLTRIVVSALRTVLETSGDRPQQGQKVSTPQRKKLLTPQMVEDEYGIQKRSLQLWRSAGTGPAYTMVGGRIFYERVRLDEYIASGRVLSVEGGV
ncbi:MAG: hypothetical protein LBD42_04145 [Desulfovibrio sp.]|jgi:hypothetical protein|nr:hypothetical protein [Desulfovibrio sp.]